MDSAHAATAAEMAEVYAVLARRDRQFDTAAPAVVLAGVTVGAPAAERLHRFGVDIHVLGESEVPSALRRGTYLLGGTAHGRWIPDFERKEEYGAEVAAVVQRARLHDWAIDAYPAPEFTRMHTPGSDSRGVVQFRRDGTDIVAKIGPADAIAGEVRFATEMNALLAGEGRRALFPEVFGLRIEGGQAVSLMEAGEPMPIGPLFADRERTTLAHDALARLEPHLDQLATWYRLTAGTRRPTVADYLYRERYHVLRGLSSFVATFRALFGEVTLTDVLDASVRLPGGLLVPGYTEAVSWLDDVVPQLLPTRGSAVHGDIYAANMLLRADGSPVLIDPRTVWEGRDRPDVGYGDPVFDLSTLLHGVLPMAAILHAVGTGADHELFGDRVHSYRGELDLSSLRLPIEFPPAVRTLEARMLRTLPYHDEPARNARTRLYIGAATSLTGWLKYQGSVRTSQAWLATFAYVTWYLWQARKVWEERDSEGKQDS